MFSSRRRHLSYGCVDASCWALNVVNLLCPVYTRCESGPVLQAAQTARLKSMQRLDSNKREWHAWTALRAKGAVALILETVDLQEIKVKYRWLRTEIRQMRDFLSVWGNGGDESVIPRFTRPPPCRSGRFQEGGWICPLSGACRPHRLIQCKRHFT